MQKVIFLIVFVPIVIFSRGNKNSFLFIENKGQFSDQYHHPRPDILFGANDGNLTFHFKKNGVSYEQYRIDKLIEEDDFTTGKKHKVVNAYSVYRTDISWLNTNANTEIQYGNSSEDFTNYYFDVCPDGVHNVRSYNEIIYKNIYNGIDLKWYEKDGHLKYDYLVSAGTGFNQIKLQINGAKKISINSKGELLIKTAFGEIVEEAPYVTQNGKALKASWKIENNIVSFLIPAYDPALSMIIDPGVRIWGTYYGGSGDDVGMGCATDNFSNVYFVGYSTSQAGTFIATTGSHQSTHGGGLEAAYVAKFKSSGFRLWATYYGGNSRDIGFSCATDLSGNVFLCGQTLTGATNVIASGGHQNVHGGNWDAFLVKFNSSGVRQWGTYYGGNNEDAGYCCITDPSGCVYMTGKTKAQGTIIATPGSHQPASYGFEEAFLVKFHPNGVRDWGTFYGATDVDIGHGLALDSEGNVYMAGHTNSTVNISTPGAHQTTHGFSGNGWDAFLAKFTSAGVRIWATYYGGNGNDLGYSCAVDQQDNVYTSGKADTWGPGNIIAIDGAHQTQFAGGNSDAFLVKFNKNGMRLWGTFYGGGGEDAAYGCTVNAANYVYLSGYTSSNAGTSIATPGSHQPLFGGFMFDGFVALFNPNGTRQWGTYYGGAQTEVGRIVATDQNYNFYTTGVTDSYTTPDIATANCHQPNYNGGFAEGYLVKFYDCTPPMEPSNASASGSQNICTGNTTTLSVSAQGSIKWYTTATSPTPVQNGSVFITPPLTTGTYTYYAGAATCTPNPVRTAITVTVHSLPTVLVAASKTLACPGESVSLFAAGVPSYTWSNGANGASAVVNPTTTTTYTVTGASVYGCTSTAVITVSMDICSTIGMKENKTGLNEIKAYPNPTSRFVTISELPASSGISVYNIIGELVMTEHCKPGSCQIDLSDKPTGVYVLKISSPEGQKVIRVFRN